MADTDLILVTEGRLQRLLAQAVYDGIRRALEKDPAGGKSRLTEEEAADYIGVSPATLRSWRCRERGPRFIKVGVGSDTCAKIWMPTCRLMYPAPWHRCRSEKSGLFFGLFRAGQLP